MATNAVYEKSGSVLTLKASGGSAVFTPKNISNGAGRLSARLDLGALPRATMYRWYAQTQVQATTPVVGNLIRQYLAWWSDDSTPAFPDGGVGSSDAAFATENDLRNLKPLPPIVVDTAAADTIFERSGMVYIPVRYVSLVWWNASGASLTNDDAEHLFQLVPIFPDIQAAA